MADITAYPSFFMNLVLVFQLQSAWNVKVHFLGSGESVQGRALEME